LSNDPLRRVRVISIAPICSARAWFESLSTTPGARSTAFERNE
jgi:hypothetical protein